MDWSLLSCGVNGHVTYAPDDPPLRDRMSVATREGAAWRCLRCGAFVLGEPDVAGPVSAVPRVRRGKEVRSTLILRVFAVERIVRALVFGALAYAIWRFKSSRLSIEQAYNHELPQLRALLHEMGFNVNHSKLLGLIQHAFTLNAHTLTWLAAGTAGYAVIEIIEAVGLWLAKRWGEYFAMVVTSIGLPYEIYDLTAKITVLRVGAFAVNLALVLYLVLTKRLFGVRGGRKAYEARLRSASILQAEIDALAAEPSQPAATGGQAAPGDPAATGGQDPVPASASAQAGATTPGAPPPAGAPPSSGAPPAANGLAPGNIGNSPVPGPPVSE
jgi:uncharacterized membrane protein (DUF2068 family)